ncbi:MAG: hypothetical protein NC911_05455 [Candidatus Omnitrophica bacterium]|nr:hypothetical protein [Candidatus Omnitrophota bacterium]
MDTLNIIFFLLGSTVFSPYFNSQDIHKGLDEPMWTPFGVKYRKGSIPATILLVYATCQASELIGYNLFCDFGKVLQFLRLCYLGKGNFYHDQVSATQRQGIRSIVNTTAMAYFFIIYAKAKGVEISFFKTELNAIKNAIKKSQRADGFFPYSEPGIWQHIFFKMHYFLPRKIYNLHNKILGDRSIFFGDAIHHIIVIYYYLLAKWYDQVPLNKSEKSMISRAFQFVQSHFFTQNDGTIMFDFSWEPKPEKPRYCNFLDTSAYFYILALLKYLVRFNLVTEEKRAIYTNGLLGYIKKYLLREGEPCLAAYQGGETFRRNLMRRPSESVFDKGFLLSELVDETTGK